MIDQTRVDKWLWAVRIFKSRSMAANACRSGRIKIADKTVKPSFLVKVGDRVHVKKDGFDLVFLIKEILSKRVSYTLAAPCYENLTSEDELNKFKNWFIGKGKAEIREKGSGRPTKKERREIEEFKDDYLFDWDE